MDLNELDGNERIIAEHAVLVYQAIRRASRVPPAEKSLLSVNSQTPAITSTIQRPAARDSPISGFTAHRLEPRLRSFESSYSPSYTITTTAVSPFTSERLLM